MTSSTVSTSRIVAYVAQTYCATMAARVAGILAAPRNAFSDSVRRSILREMKKQGAA